MNARFDHLGKFGWSEFWEAQFRPEAAAGYAAGRVILEHKDLYRLYAEGGELTAELAGRLRHEAASRADLPAGGDWVAIRPRVGEGKATIHAVLPRRSGFTRRAAGGRTEEQVVGANIDTVFLVTALNQDFNLRRIERYLVVAWESGARPVVVLSKSDLCDDLGARVSEVEAVAAGAPVHAVSVVTRAGLDALSGYFAAGQTVALLGSSGVGKSTLINDLLGRDLQAVQAIREHDGRGRHTTTHRELIALSGGGLVLDTPGMRELQLWDAGEGLHRAFDEIEDLAARCRFRDCRHGGEPGCAVRDALDEGSVDEARYQSYEKLRKELRYLEVKQDKQAQAAQKSQWKKLCREANRRARQKRGGF